MGFLSKLMKNPLVQMALPMAMTMFVPWAAGATGLSGIMGGMNPMARNMLMQSAMGYGTAALSGSKRPEKAAMYAGLASLPFSYMSASQAANAYNQKFAGEQGVQRFMESPGKEAFTSSVGVCPINTSGPSFSTLVSIFLYGVSIKPKGFVFAYVASDTKSPILGPSGVSIGHILP